MTQEQIIWLIVGLVVLIVIIAIIAAVVGRNRRRQREADHASAEQLRADAARQQDRVAAESQSAESARLEAEAAEADARRLREEAEERERVAAQSQQSLDGQLRTADRLDPEVATDREGHRKDGTDPREAVLGAGAAGAAGAGAAHTVNHQQHDDGPAAAAATSPEQDETQQAAAERRETEQFRPVGEETQDEHDVVERRLAADPRQEPQESVAAEAGRPEVGQSPSSSTTPGAGTAAAVGGAGAAAGAGTAAASERDGDQFRAAGEETAEEHDVVQRQLAEDSASEPRESVAAEAGRSEAGPPEVGQPTQSYETVEPEERQPVDQADPQRGSGSGAAAGAAVAGGAGVAAVAASSGEDRRTEADRRSDGGYSERTTPGDESDRTVPADPQRAESTSAASVQPETTVPADQQSAADEAQGWSDEPQGRMEEPNGVQAAEPREFRASEESAGQTVTPSYQQQEQPATEQYQVQEDRPVFSESQDRQVHEQSGKEQLVNEQPAQDAQSTFGQDATQQKGSPQNTVQQDDPLFQEVRSEHSEVDFGDGAGYQQTPPPVPASGHSGAPDTQQFRTFEEEQYDGEQVVYPPEQEYRKGTSSLGSPTPEEDQDPDRPWEQYGDGSRPPRG